MLLRYRCITRRVPFEELAWASSPPPCQRCRRPGNLSVQIVVVGILRGAAEQVMGAERPAWRFSLSASSRSPASARLQVANYHALHHSAAHFRPEHTFRLTPKVSLLFIRHYEDWAETNVCRIGQEGQPKLKESVSTSILDDDPSYSLNFGSPLDFGVSPDSSLYLPRSLNPLPQRCTICQRLGSSGKPVRVWICRATDYGRKESRKVLFVFGEPCTAGIRLQPEGSQGKGALGEPCLAHGP